MLLASINTGLLIPCGWLNGLLTSIDWLNGLLACLVWLNGLFIGAWLKEGQTKLPCRSGGQTDIGVCGFVKQERGVDADSVEWIKNL